MPTETYTDTPSTAAHSAVQAEFGTFATLRALFSIPRSTAYQLEQEGEIRFVRLRKRGNSRGRVLVVLDSVREYLGRCASADTAAGKKP